MKNYVLQNINDISISEFTDRLYCIYDDLPFAAKLEVLDITACILRGETAYDEIEFVSFICETNLDYFLNMICYHLENQIECIYEILIEFLFIIQDNIVNIEWDAIEILFQLMNDNNILKAIEEWAEVYAEDDNEIEQYVELINRLLNQNFEDKNIFEEYENFEDND